MWKPISRAFDRIEKLYAGDLPAGPPPIDMSTAIRQAKLADSARYAAHQQQNNVEARMKILENALADNASGQEEEYRSDYIRRAIELLEAKHLGGTGPWLVSDARGSVNSPNLPQKIRESNPISAQGAYGDIELALQNVDWRREINLSWMEFSRWGIQQIILISRLYYIKNPIIRRLVDIAASYVFGRGFEVSSPDEDANKVLKDFFERNQATLGQIAMTNHERSKYTDGNLFFVFFKSESTGDVNIRTIDATEIQDIICDPNDTDSPWFYRRCWTVRNFDKKTGVISTKSEDAWYPALSYDPGPDDRPPAINDVPVKWDMPVHHRKCGAVAKWHFGCPLIYPALDWAREARRFLEACASVMQALSRIALKITTKGGQQALQGVKLQMQTSVGPTNPIWEQNPPTIPGGTFGSGPGTNFEAFKTQGAGQDPEKVRQYKLMACMTVGVPETFLADVSTGNLATATTLDRPTELVFLERQEAWREDLVVIGKYVLAASAQSPAGALREALELRRIPTENITFSECARAIQADGRMGYVTEAAGKNKMGKPGVIEVKATFPSIREGDIPALIAAVVESMTLGNKGGQIVGIDEKEAVKLLYEYLGVENGDELAEDQYPESEYDPDRTKQILPPPIGKIEDNPGGQPQFKARQKQPPPAEPPAPKPPSKTAKEATSRLIAALQLQESATPLNGDMKV